MTACDIQDNYDEKELYFTLTGAATSNDSNILENDFNIALGKCFPNPFNPSTSITYSLPANSINNFIDIYNVKGQKVKSIKLQHDPGYNNVEWKGIDDKGNPVASGIYFYTLKSDGFVSDKKKMILLK